MGAPDETGSSQDETGSSQIESDSNHFARTRVAGARTHARPTPATATRGGGARSSVVMRGSCRHQFHASPSTEQRRRARATHGIEAELGGGDRSSAAGTTGRGKFTWIRRWCGRRAGARCAAEAENGCGRCAAARGAWAAAAVARGGGTWAAAAGERAAGAGVAGTSAGVTGTAAERRRARPQAVGRGRRGRRTREIESDRTR
jgi:hypothetical protein